MALERLFRPTQPSQVQAPDHRVAGLPVKNIVFGKDAGAGTGQAPQDISPTGQPPTGAQAETPKINLVQPGTASSNEGLHETDLTQAYDPADHFGGSY